MAQTLDRGNCGIARFRGKEVRGQSSAPRRGSAIIAQGKAAEAAALGKRPPPDIQPPLFPGLPCRAGPARQTRKKGRGLFCARNPGRLVPRLPWAIIMASLRDFNRVDGGHKLAPHSAVRCSVPEINGPVVQQEFTFLLREACRPGLPATAGLAASNGGREQESAEAIVPKATSRKRRNRRASQLGKG